MLKISCSYKIWALIFSSLMFNIPFLMYIIDDSFKNSEHHHYHSKRSLLDALQTQELEWSKSQDSIDDYFKNNEHHHHRSKRSLQDALQTQELEWSKGQEDAALFKKLLKLSKVSEMCADFQQQMQGEEGHLHNNSDRFQLVQVHVFVSPGQTIPEKEIPALRLPSISSNHFILTTVVGY